MIDLSRLISLNRIMNILPPVLINQIETKSQRLYNNDVWKEKKKEKKNRPIPDSKHRIIGLVKQLRSANYGIKYANQASYIHRTGRLRNYVNSWRTIATTGIHIYDRREKKEEKKKETRCLSVNLFSASNLLKRLARVTRARRNYHFNRAAKRLRLIARNATGHDVV